MEGFACSKASSKLSNHVVHRYQTNDLKNKINGPKMAAPTPWEPGPPATSPTCSTNYSKHCAGKKTFASLRGILSCTTTFHKTSDAPSLAGITPQTLAALISRPIRPPDQEHLDFLLSALLRTTVALDRRVLVYQDAAPFANDSAQRSRTKQAPTCSRFQPSQASPSP